MSLSNVKEGYNNLLEEYKSLEKENKSLRNALYKPEKTIFHKRNETNPDVSTWNHGFLAGFSAALIGTYLGMIFSHYYY
jgi:regulator of replication initiation timing